MRTLGAVLESVEPGTVTITCRFDEGLTQQRGLLHGGVVASLVDVACGYASLSGHDGIVPELSTRLFDIPRTNVNAAASSDITTPVVPGVRHAGTKTSAIDTGVIETRTAREL